MNTDQITAALEAIAKILANGSTLNSATSKVCNEKIKDLIEMYPLAWKDDNVVRVSESR
jgi:uncharacterized protein YcfL